MCVAEINLFSCNRCLWIYRMQWLCLHDRMNLCRKFRAEITDCGEKKMPNDGNETFDMEHLLELAEEKNTAC